jgi:hypothetical protein
LLFGQRATNGAPGEAAALVDLLVVLELNGATVTADAGNFTPAVARAVCRAGCDACAAAAARYKTAPGLEQECRHVHVRAVLAWVAYGLRGVARPPSA